MSPPGCGVKWTGTETTLKSSVAVDGTNDLPGPDVSSNLLALLVTADHGIISVHRVSVEDRAHLDHALALWPYATDVSIMTYLETSIMVGLGVQRPSAAGYCCMVPTGFRREGSMIREIRTQSGLEWTCGTTAERGLSLRCAEKLLAGLTRWTDMALLVVAVVLQDTEACLISVSLKGYYINKTKHASFTLFQLFFGYNLRVLKIKLIQNK